MEEYGGQSRPDLRRGSCVESCLGEHERWKEVTGA